MRRLLLSILFFALTGPLAAQDLRLPMKNGSVKFAVIGDTGTGSSSQYEIAKQLTAFRAKFPFTFTIMMGDNLYGGEQPSDYSKKFELPYKALLDGGVKFYASLGNHDDPNQRMFKPFNMNGERYYSFKPSLNAGIRFFALDSNYMDPKQVQWLEKELAASGSDWKVAFFHHPPYASGQHGSHVIVRDQVEPLFLKYGVNVVFNGHEHFYERIKPQKGIQYFVAGGSAKVRRGDIAKTGLTAFGYDEGYSFMILEVAGDEMHYQVINQKGQTIDTGVILKGDNNRVISTAGQVDRTPARTPPAQPDPPRPATPAKPAR
jgi:calcineurin-like phosphoesterase family protein